jgi:hypothetical protein
MRKLVLAFFFAGCGGNTNNNSDGGGSCTNFGPVCLSAPLTTAARTPCGDVTEYCDKTSTAAPNLSCLTTPKSDGSGPATVTLTGFVHAFSAGPDSGGVSLALYDAATLAGGADPMTVTPIAKTVAMLDPATQRACDLVAANGCSIPSATGCTLPKCNDGLSGRTDDRKYCRDLGGGNTSCSDRLRWEARYTLTNVPTNKQLVIRTAGPNGMADNTWAALAAWNIYLSTADRKCEDLSASDCLDTSDMANPKYQLNVNALSKSDYVNIPTTSGLAGGITSGEGAIAGEVHDCDNIRVGNVAVGTSPGADRFTYFNGNPIMTLPDSGRFSSGTDRLGLFAALNLKPGKISIQAAGLVGTTLTSFGSFDAFVYPDTVSVVNVNGGKPH